MDLDELLLPQEDDEGLDEEVVADEDPHPPLLDEEPKEEPELLKEELEELKELRDDEDENDPAST